MEKRFDTGEVVLNYTEIGEADPGNHPPLLLLHRLTSRWQSWRDYLAPLSAEWRVYAPDLRGHGLSAHSHTGYRAVDYARDVSAFLAARLSAPAVLCGHSGGALAAMLAAAQDPQMVRGLLLSEPPLYLLHHPVEAEPATDDWFRMVERVRQEDLPVEAIAALIRERFPRVRPDTALDTAAAVAQVDPAVPRAALSGALVDGLDLEATLRQITCPVTFLQGEKSLGASLWDEDVLRIQSALPLAQIHKFPQTGHNTVDRVETVIGYLKALR